MKSQPRQTTSEEVVQAALSQIKNLPKLAEAADNLPAIGELFRRINLQMFLRFQQVRKTKRVVNQLSGGIITIGAAVSPIQKYTCPTDRGCLQKNRIYNEKCPPENSGGQMLSSDSGKSAESLGNANRENRSPIELFLVSVAGWEPHVIRLVQAA